MRLEALSVRLEALSVKMETPYETEGFLCKTEAIPVRLELFLEDCWLYL